MKLKRTMFFDPEPEAPDFDYVDANKEAWDNLEKAHSAWKARNVKPEMPESPYSYNTRLAWIGRKGKGIGNWKEWEDYFKALQHYEENRRRWDGFKTKRHDNGMNYYTDDISVWFYDSHDCVKVFLPKKSSSVSMFDGLSISLFEQIAKENGIELKKIL